MITEDTVVPPKSLILGSPAKVKRAVTDQELASIRESAQNYNRYSRQYLSGSDKPRPGFWVQYYSRAYPHSIRRFSPEPNKTNGITDRR